MKQNGVTKNNNCFGEECFEEARRAYYEAYDSAASGGRAWPWEPWWSRTHMG